MYKFYMIWGIGLICPPGPGVSSLIRINLPASNEAVSPSRLFHYITAIDSRPDDASTDVSLIRDDEYDGEVNEVHSRLEHSRYNHRVIRDFSDSNDDEYDDTEHDVHRSLKHFRYNYRVIRNSLMSTCQCGHCKLGKVFLCSKCDLTFRCRIVTA